MRPLGCTNDDVAGIDIDAGAVVDADDALAVLCVDCAVLGACLPPDDAGLGNDVGGCKSNLRP